MGHEIIDLLSMFGRVHGVKAFYAEDEIVRHFTDRFLGSWRARRTLRAMANCGAIFCRSKKTGFHASVDVPWHKAGDEWARSYRLMPFGWQPTVVSTP